MPALAYLFWHWPRRSAGADAYERVLADFHRALEVAGPAGFDRSLCFRLDTAPWDAAEDSPYEDWYLLDGWASLGALNEAAVTGRCAGPHERVAAMSAQGAGGVYRLRGGEADAVSSKSAIWFHKPGALGYAQLDAALAPALAAGGVLWQRQLVLGPAPEFCLLCTGPVSLPPGIDASNQPRSRVAG